jgi:3-hydroxyacyl-[acyl-carrier-protein] dehydratase
LRFLLLDRVSRLECAKRIEASRSVSLTEDYFSEHFPGNPIVPASLLFESFAQAATCLLETSCAFRKKAVPGFIHAAKFHRAVVPGHELSIQMMVESSTQDATMVSGIARQRDQRCATITLGMITTPFDEFVPRRFRWFYLAIYDIWLRGAALEGFDGDPLEALRHDAE